MAKKVKKKWYQSWEFKHIFVAVAAALVSVFVLFHLLGLITRHNKSIEVPDFTDMSIEQARKLAHKSDVRLKISDSVYIPQVQAGQVLKQIPAGGSKVKKNRRILITINSLVPAMVKVPNVVGYSLRQAASNLRAANLYIGKLTYVSDIATNNVMEQYYKGSQAVPGMQVPSQSEIDLTLGLNSSDCMTRIPNLIAVPYYQVKSELLYNYLNLNKVVFDKGIKTYSDSLQAVVYKQEPSPTVSNSVRMGTGVTLYFTMDKSLAENNKKRVKAVDLAVEEEKKESEKKEAEKPAATPTESQTEPQESDEPIL